MHRNRIKMMNTTSLMEMRKKTRDLTMVRNSPSLRQKLDNPLRHQRFVINLKMLLERVWRFIRYLNKNRRTRIQEINKKTFWVPLVEEMAGETAKDSTQICSKVITNPCFRLLDLREKNKTPKQWLHLQKKLIKVKSMSPSSSKRWILNFSKTKRVAFLLRLENHQCLLPVDKKL